MRATTTRGHIFCLDCLLFEGSKFLLEKSGGERVLLKEGRGKVVEFIASDTLVIEEYLTLFFDTKKCATFD